MYEHAKRRFWADVAANDVSRETCLTANATTPAAPSSIPLAATGLGGCAMRLKVLVSLAMQNDVEPALIGTVLNMVAEAAAAKLTSAP